MTNCPECGRFAKEYMNLADGSKIFVEEGIYCPQCQEFFYYEGYPDPAKPSTIRILTGEEQPTMGIQP